MNELLALCVGVGPIRAPKPIKAVRTEVSIASGTALKSPKWCLIAMGAQQSAPVMQIGDNKQADCAKEEPEQNWHIQEDRECQRSNCKSNQKRENPSEPMLARGKLSCPTVNNALIIGCAKFCHRSNA